MARFKVFKSLGIDTALTKLKSWIMANKSKATIKKTAPVTKVSAKKNEMDKAVNIERQEDKQTQVPDVSPQQSLLDSYKKSHP